MTRSSPRRALLREPALHFVAVAALVALADHGCTSRAAPSRTPTEDTRPAITLSAEQLASLRSKRAAMDPTMRPELHAMIDAWVDEEVLVREAQALSQDHRDETARPRMIQWMRAVLEARARVPPPSEAALRAYYEDHLDAFRDEPRYDFERLTLSTPADADATAPTVDSALSALTAGADPRTLEGARFDRWEYMRAPQMARSFGAGFARALEAATPGRWRALEGAPSLTLVRLLRVHPGGDTPPFESVRGRVELHHRRDAIRAQVSAALQDARRRYRVLGVPKPPPTQ